jgi:hypothetical protein
MFARNPFIDDGAHVLAGRQTPLFPTGYASLQIGGLDPSRAQRRCRALTILTAMTAIGHDRTTERQFFQPMVHVSGQTMKRANDQSIVGIEVVLPTNVYQQRRRGDAEIRIEIGRRNREKIFVHVPSPLR